MTDDRQPEDDERDEGEPGPKERLEAARNAIEDAAREADEAGRQVKHEVRQKLDDAGDGG